MTKKIFFIEPQKKILLLALQPQSLELNENRKKVSEERYVRGGKVLKKSEKKLIFLING
jgi:hypothetical protein